MNTAAHALDPGPGLSGCRADTLAGWALVAVCVSFLVSLFLVVLSELRPGSWLHSVVARIRSRARSESESASESSVASANESDAESEHAALLALVGAVYGFVRLLREQQRQGATLEQALKHEGLDELRQAVTLALGRLSEAERAAFGGRRGHPGHAAPKHKNGLNH